MKERKIGILMAAALGAVSVLPGSGAAAGVVMDPPAAKAEAGGEGRAGWPARQWGVVTTLAKDAAGKASALVASADAKLRAARDSAAEYVNKHAAATPRMRGVHLYVALPAETVLDTTEEPVPESDLPWLTLAESRPPAHIVLLVHGLDEPGKVWDDLAPVLAEAGHSVARFDYPNDQGIAASADLLGAALRELRAAGVERVDLVCHSMGGLVSRDALTREEHYGSRGRGHGDLPDVGRLIMLGTPNHGSRWAHLQCLSDAGEQVARFAGADEWDARHLLGFLADGRGEAAKDLLPGSAFLNELNARPAPEGVLMTTVVAVIDPRAGDEQVDALAAAATDESAAMDDEEAATPGRMARLRAAVGGKLGDGVVSASAAQLEGAEAVFIEASHRGMVRASRLEGAVRWVVRKRQDEPPAVPVILERLGERALPPG